jgi:MFS family permease
MSRLPDSPDLSDEIDRDERLPMTTQERRLVLTSSIGTIFQWYDFFLYGAMASVIARQFFTSLEPGAAFILTLLAFAAGFVVRPIGAVIFGHLGDRIGRKQTFLATVLLMGISTVQAGRLSFTMAAFIGALSGLLIGPTTTVFYDSGFLIGLKGFVAAVFAGLSSYPLALVGAMGVGLLESFGSFWASSFKEVIVFTSILPVLLWRSLRDPHHEED